MRYVLLCLFTVFLHIFNNPMPMHQEAPDDPEGDGGTDESDEKERPMECEKCDAITFHDVHGTGHVNADGEHIVLTACKECDYVDQAELPTKEFYALMRGDYFG